MLLIWYALLKEQKTLEMDNDVRHCNGMPDCCSEAGYELGVRMRVRHVRCVDAFDIAVGRGNHSVP